MTISTEIRKAGPFTGNGIATSYPFAFKIFASSDVTVIVRINGVEELLIEGADYSVAFNENDQDDNPGGVVTFPLEDSTFDTLTSTQRLVVISTLEYLQQTDLENGGNFHAQIHEDRFDYLTILIQQLLEELSRTLRIPVTSDSDVSTLLPLPEPYALIGWNSTGTALVNYTINDILALLGGGGTGGGGEGGGEPGLNVFNNPVVFNNTATFNDEVTFNDVTHFEVPPDLPPNSIGLDVLKDEVIGALIDPLAFSFNGESADDVLTTDHTFTVHLFNCTILAARAGAGVGSSSGDVEFDFGRDGGNSLFTGQATLPQGDDLVDLTSLLDADEVAVTDYEKFVGTISDAGADVTGFKIYLDVIHGGNFSVLPTEPPVTVPDTFKTGDYKLTNSLTPDDGWLLCNGAAVSRTVYSRLFAKIGTTWGAGNGTTTFNLPDSKGRSPFGAGSGAGLTARAIGDTFGVESVQLTAAQSGLVGHTHTAVASGGGTLPLYAGGSEDGPYQTVEGRQDNEASPVGTADLTGGGISVSVSAVAAAPAAEAHSTISPGFVTAIHIKT